MSKKSIIIICGPTATGKTSLGINIAQSINGEIISCDSRQVYKYMDIITGKDIPENFQFYKSKISYKQLNIGYYTNKNLKIWGYDLCSPKTQFNVHQYLEFIVRIFNYLWSQNKIPIIVGGTGLYIQSILKPPKTLGIPKNINLRDHLKRKNANELYEELSKINPTKAKKLNNSEKHNHHRLIRAIEISKNKYSQKNFLSHQLRQYMRLINPKIEPIIIGLKYSKKNLLYKQINSRVINRLLNPKLPDEINFLIENNLLQHAPSNTIGYKQIIHWMNNQLKFSNMITQWQIAEHQYSKRQITWFAKQNSIKWFNITPNIESKIVKYIDQCYTK